MPYVRFYLANVTESSAEVLYDSDSTKLMQVSVKVDGVFIKGVTTGLAGQDGGQWTSDGALQAQTTSGYSYLPRGIGNVLAVINYNLTAEQVCVDNGYGQDFDSGSTDTYYGENSTQTSRRCYDPTYRPIAVIDNPSSNISVAPGESVAFSGSVSNLNATSGDLTFQWTISGYGTVDGDRVEHVFSEPGTYSVSLVVRDQMTKLSSNTVRRTITVGATADTQGPVISFVPYTGPLLADVNQDDYGVSADHFIHSALQGTYVDAGATSEDDVDGSLNVTTIRNEFQTSSASRGSEQLDHMATIRYYSIDDSSNSTTKDRLVYVAPRTDPGYQMSAANVSLKAVHREPGYVTGYDDVNYGVSYSSPPSRPDLPTRYPTFFLEPRVHFSAIASNYGESYANNLEVAYQRFNMYKSSSGTWLIKYGVDNPGGSIPLSTIHKSVWNEDGTYTNPLVLQYTLTAGEAYDFELVLKTEDNSPRHLVGSNSAYVVNGEVTPTIIAPKGGYIELRHPVQYTNGQAGINHPVGLYSTEDKSEQVGTFVRYLHDEDDPDARPIALWKVPETAGIYYYQCSIHENMGGILEVIDSYPDSASIDIGVHDETPPGIILLPWSAQNGALEGSTASTVRLAQGHDIGSLATSDIRVGVTDSEDASIVQSSVVTEGDIDTSTLGTYTRTYTATDGAGNTTTLTRTFIVEVGPAPTITLTPPNPMQITQFTAFSDPGWEIENGNLTLYTPSAVDISTPGTYTVRYQAGGGGRTVTATRTVEVLAFGQPTITLVEGDTVQHEAGSQWSDPGATAVDGQGVSISVTSDANVINENPSLYNSAGTHTITYTATDSHGQTTTVTRTLEIVEPNTAPVITLQGDSYMTLETYNQSWSEPGYSAIDNGVDVSSSVEITYTLDNSSGSDQTVSSLDSTVEGTYTVRYSITDSEDSSIVVSATRTVVVGVHRCPVVEDEELEEGAPNMSGLTYADRNVINYNGVRTSVSGFTTGQWSSLAQNVGLAPTFIQNAQLVVRDNFSAGDTNNFMQTPLLDGTGRVIDLTTMVSNVNYAKGISTDLDGAEIGVNKVSETITKFLSYSAERGTGVRESLEKFNKLATNRLEYPFDWHCALESKFAGQDVVIMASDARGVIDLSDDTVYPEIFVKYRLEEMYARGHISRSQLLTKLHGVNSEGLVSANGEKLSASQIAAHYPERAESYRKVHGKVVERSESLNVSSRATFMGPTPTASGPIPANTDTGNAQSRTIYDTAHNSGVVRSPSVPEFPLSAEQALSATESVVLFSLDNYLRESQKTPLFLNALHDYERTTGKRVAVLNKIESIAEAVGVTID